MTDRNELTLEFAREAFDYIDGDLIWRSRPAHHFVDAWRQRIFNSRQAGTKAGTVSGGYRFVNLSVVRTSAHRVVFLLHHGYMPPEVDHIDGNRLNNRIENLRAASHAENLKNVKTPTTNTSGRKGVSWHKAANKWAAHIREGGRQKHLGLYEEFASAAAAREHAEHELYKEFANGR